MEGTPQPSSGSYTDWLIQDERHRRMHVVGLPGTAGRTRTGAKEARLSYRLLSSDGRISLVEVALETGQSTRSACKWPIMDTRLWATANTAAS